MTDTQCNIITLQLYDSGGIMASFVQKFGFSKKNGGGNSIQQEVILGSMKEAQESLANQVSQNTSSASNIETILIRGSKSLAPDIKTHEGMLLEKEIEENLLERLLKEIALTSSPEELSALMQKYEDLVASWSDKASKLRSEKRLKEYLSTIAALTMLQKMMQNPNLLLSGKKLAETLQIGLISQTQIIEYQAKAMQAQNQKLHEQTQQLTKHLSGTEQLLQASIQASKKDPGKITPEKLQNNLKQLQESLKQLQDLKEKTISGKQLDFKEMLENSQNIHRQQWLIQSSKLGDLTLQSILQLQKPLEQALQQENITRSQITQIEQVRQNARQIIEAQISVLAKEKLPAPTLLSNEVLSTKNNVIDITTRLKERTEIKSSAYTPLSKDPLSQGHICTASCNHGHSHTAHQNVHPRMMGSDTVSKAHVCTGQNCCGVKSHIHGHESTQTLQPKAMGTDTVSKANAHGPGCGCSSCGGGHKQQTQHKAQTEKHEHHKHEHGPSCSCCGHGAKATEIGRSQHLARVS